jgi:hypothetical protein
MIISRLICLGSFALALAAAAGATVHPDGFIHAEFRSAASDLSSILVVPDGETATSIPITDKGVQAAIKDKFIEGDRVDINIVNMSVQDIAAQTRAVTPMYRFGVLAMVALIHLLFGAILLRSRLKQLVIGEDNRYSNSKFQMVTWFTILAVTYISAVWLRFQYGNFSSAFTGGVELPKNLLLLSGLSALTFGAAKGIATSKSAVVGPKKPADAPHFPSDLLCDDDGNPDVGDYQMIAVTAMAVVVYFVQIFGFLGSIALVHSVTIPDVDTTILATFGLGQGAYLAKKQLSNGAT